MALIKEKTNTKNGSSGDYWRIVQNNNNYNRNDNVWTLQLYAQNTNGRYEHPLDESVQFTFNQDDHNFDDYDLDLVDKTFFTGAVRNLELHCRYQHIKNVAKIARTKQEKIDTSEHPEEEEQLTDNEKKALFFDDAIDG